MRTVWFLVRIFCTFIPCEKYLFFNWVTLAVCWFPPVSVQGKQWLVVHQCNSYKNSFQSNISLFNNSSGVICLRLYNSKTCNQLPDNFPIIYNWAITLKSVNNMTVRTSTKICSLITQTFTNGITFEILQLLWYNLPFQKERLCLTGVVWRFTTEKVMRANCATFTAFT